MCATVIKKAATSIIWLWASFVLAATVEFDVQPRVLRVGEAAVMSLTVRGLDNPAQPNFPTIEGLDISFAGTERSFSIGTAGTDQSVTFRFRVVPTRTGTYKLGPYRYRTSAGEVELPAIELTVVPPEERTQNPTSPEELLFARLRVAPTNLYSQQVFDFIVEVYAAERINLARDISLMNLPSSGLALKPFQTLPMERVLVGQRIFNVQRFVAKASVLSAGEMTLAPVVRVSVVVPKERRSPRDPFFDPFDSLFDDFFGRVQTQQVDLRTPALVLNILPLPGNPPASFAGGVGRFDYRVDAKPLEVLVGEPVTITLTVQGEGNVENIGAPPIPANDDWRFYEPKLVSSEINEQVAAGRKIFELVAIPKTTGRVELPTFEFCYFDPIAGEYRTLRHSPFVVAVKPSTSIVARVVESVGSPPTQVTPVGRDIVYLKPAPRHWHRKSAGVSPNTLAFWSLQGVPVLAFLAALFWQRRRSLLEENVALARRARAPRAARSGLQAATRALRHRNRQEFFEALFKTLSEYFGNRLNLPPGAVTSADVLARLRQSGLASDQLANIERIYRLCEEARYAKAENASTPADEIQQWKTVLRQLEEAIHACERVKL